MKFDSLAKAEEKLHSFAAGVKRTGDDQSLVRMWPLLEAVGNPHEKLKVIHVAGTSGKTSTCYYIASLLQTSAVKVGLTVSPHVDSITERVQIDGQPLSESEFCSELELFLSLIEGKGDPSYFEILIVFVLWEFERKGVDYVVLETGMGGLYDGTNVVTRADKVCVITDIGYDHMHVLGSTIDLIAAQKAGIIHDKNVVFSQQQETQAMKQINVRVAAKKAKLMPINRTLIAKNSQLALYQQRNWALAISVASYIAQRDGLQLNHVDPTHVMIPGRMEETILQDDSILVMDGAHNGQKMRAFVSSFQAKYHDQKATVLLALKQGKEFQEVVNELRPITKELIVTTFTTFQDLPFSAQDPDKIAAYAQNVGMQCRVEQDYTQAYSALVTSESSIKIVTGSFYLLGQIRCL